MLNRYPKNYYKPSKKNNLLPILIVIGVIVLAFLVLRSAGVGGLSNSDYETIRNKTIRSEMQSASSAVNSLSRLGATSTSSVLSRVRQHVHGIEVINELNVSMYGEVGRLYQSSTFLNIYTIIDNYEVCLATGQKVNDPLNQLTVAIGDLERQTNIILNISVEEP